MPFECSRTRVLAGALAAVFFLAACKGDAPRSGVSPRTTDAPASGVVRVGVWQPNNPALGTYGGAAVRSLIYPQLFRATPSGAWEPSIVVPGSDATAPGAMSARFKIRPNAFWSDGTRVGVRDLRRTVDSRFVTRVDAPNTRGEVVVHFTQKLPGWRRLWSGLDTIAPPKEGLSGGPYKLDHVTPNLETVLTANPRYYDPPRIREVHLVTVPQAEIAIRLMERGDLDVLAPPAFTDRTARLERVNGAHVVRGTAKGGDTVALVANPARLSTAQRLPLMTLIDRTRFVDVVLHGEAVGQSRPSAPVAPTPTSMVPSVSEPVESPAVSQFVHAMQRRGRKTGVTFDVRQGEFDQILGAYARSEFDLFVNIQPTLPDRCWVCEASTVDAALARDADAGAPGAAARLERLLEDSGTVVPLWREIPVVAVRDGLEGVSANGFSIAGPAWDIVGWHWHR